MLLKAQNRVVPALGSVDEVKWDKEWKLLSCTLLFIILLYKVVLTFESVDKILNCDHSNEFEGYTAEQYFPVVLFIMLYKVAYLFSPWMKSTLE